LKKNKIIFHKILKTSTENGKYNGTNLLQALVTVFDSFRALGVNWNKKTTVVLH